MIHTGIYFAAFITAILGTLVASATIGIILTTSRDLDETNGVVLLFLFTLVLVGGSAFLLGRIFGA